MKNDLNKLQQYREFLDSIPLREYGEEFRPIKWVEQDLPRELLPQGSIFRHYWDEQNFLDFESWFENFWQELHSNRTSVDALKCFKKYYFDKNNDGWFKLGFKARMYRTWTAMLTQLDFCYMFGYVCSKQAKSVNLECNAELDKSGVDLRIGDMDFEVSKITHRKEARSAQAARRNRIRIPYAVFNVSEYERLSGSSRVSLDNRKKYHRALQAFQKYFLLLRNGFVVFSEGYVDQVVRNLDNAEKLKARIATLLLELSGESP